MRGETSLPVNWAASTLGELGDYVNGRGFAKSEWSAQGRPIIRIQDLTGTGDRPNYFEGAIDDKYVVQPGDLLVSWAATLGAFIWRGPEGVLNQHIFKVRSFIDQTFHYYLIQAVLQDLYRQTHGSGMVHITRGKFDATPVGLPPLSEQQRIVAAIEEHFTWLDAGVASLRRLQAALKRYRAAVLKAAVEGKLTEAWRAEHPDVEPTSRLLERILAERRARWEADLRAKGKDVTKTMYEEPAAADSSDVPIDGLPEGWCWATLEQLSDSTRTITYGVIKLGDPIPEGVPVLRSSNVRHLHLALEGLKSISPNIAREYARTFLQGGELLVTVRGTLGGVVVVPSSCAGFNISREVAMVALGQPAFGPCLATFVGSGPIEGWLLQNAKGIAYTGINIETLKQTPVPLPPLIEQAEIVAEVERRLSIVREVEATVEANLKRANRLRQAILQEAFAGRLVPQDPRDEPASVLLERIRRGRNGRTSGRADKRREPELVGQTEVASPATPR